MDKNRFLNHKVLSKTNIALVCVLGMLFGFLCGRAFLSIFMIVFGLNALRDVHPKNWVKQKWWLLGAAWVGMYALSYFWTDSKSIWGERFEVKAPILLLPLAFAFLPAFSLKQLRIFTVAAGLILLGGIGYSVSRFVERLDYYLAHYYMSTTMPTPVYGDHIRFSLCISLFIVWCFYIWPSLNTKALKWFTGIIIAIFAAYLHLLAARTGLLVLYVFILLSGIYIGIKRSKALGFGIIAGFIAFAFLATEYVPTLKQRVGYINYTYIQYKEGNMSALYSDLGRLISYDVATDIIKGNSILGVGSGDMMDEMRAGYKREYPDVTDDRVLLPHNQFFIVTLACGVPALLLFLGWVFAPLSILKRTRDGFYFFVVWLALLLPMLFEPMLEIQFGVFVYLFFLLWQRHMLVNGSEKTGVIFFGTILKRPVVNFIPIFPLDIVVYPGEPLNLHIFEPRYKQLIKECIADKKNFGIPVVLSNHTEVHGTLMEVVELVKEYENGEMDIRTRGVKVFRILETIKELPEKLYSGAIVSYPHNEMEQDDTKIAKVILDEVKRLYALLNVSEKFPADPESPISYSIAHFIGLSKHQEYELLNIFTEVQRLEYIRRHLKKITETVKQFEQMKSRIQMNGHFRNLSLGDKEP